MTIGTADHSTRGGRRWLLALVLVLVGVPLIAGGAYLAVLGGSPYYLIAGLMTLISAWFAWRGDPRAPLIYAAMLAGTVAWAVWECGSDVWGLQARVIAPLVLGVWVCFPWIRRLPPRISIGVFTAILLALIGYLHFADEDRGSIASALVANSGAGSGEWLHYGNDEGGSRFSPLTRINRTNIGQLREAWTYRTGETHNGNGFEATPLMIGATLYLCTSTDVIHAVDAETGKRRWLFDPKIIAPPPSAACRGVVYFKTASERDPCHERIIVATIDARMMALDAHTGVICQTFGNRGTIDLKAGLGDVLKDYYYVSSVPALVRGKLVIGGSVMDGQKTNEPSGVVRAFDATTGKFQWAWDMDRPDQHGEPGPGQTYSRATANSWAPMSGDDALGLVYVPTGNSTPDYWGAHRTAGSEKYASSVVALDIETGAARWNFQTTHHDLWDYDVASQPTLIDLPIGGKIVPALLQPTKRGEIFLLDRRTGQPLANVQEKAVPQQAVSGDRAAPTQPFSVGMPAFGRDLLTEAGMWGATPLDQLWCRIKFKEARYDGLFTPPGLRPTVTYPSFLGGMNWGGVAVDPERHLMVVNWNRMANYTRLIARKDADAQGITYAKNGGTPHLGVINPQIGTPFTALTGPFLSPLQMPCTAPPFGKIAVVDLNRRQITWQKPLGNGQDSGPMGYRSRLTLPLGVPNHGGSLITRGGLVFIGATQERRFRAFDIDSGEQLWSARLPSGGNASPMSYISPASGRQFVVIAAGGSAPMASGASDHLIAYAMR